MSRSARIAVLVLPLLAIGLGIVRAEIFRENAQTFVFRIQGYDPRDLLRGHYLQFRLRLDPMPDREPCEEASGTCCLCLTRVAPDVPPLAERATCATARSTCNGALSTRYAESPQRFYVPEEHARALEERLVDAMQRDRAEAVLDVDRSGEARVRELRVDGEPLRP